MCSADGQKAVEEQAGAAALVADSESESVTASEASEASASAGSEESDFSADESASEGLEDSPVKPAKPASRVCSCRAVCLSAVN